MAGALVLIACRRSCNDVRSLAIGFFAGKELYRNTLDPAMRFVGRKGDDVGNDVDKNQLLAAVHVVTVTHLQGEEAPRIDPVLMTPVSMNDALPEPLSLIVADMQQDRHAAEGTLQKHRATTFLEYVARVNRQRADVPLGSDKKRIETLSDVFDIVNDPLSTKKVQLAPTGRAASASRNPRRAPTLLSVLKKAAASVAAHTCSQHNALRQLHGLEAQEACQPLKRKRKARGA
jgi:hypothetical protein